MKILEAKMQNFRAVKEAEFSFTDGITVFSGENGEGKSTFLQSLSMVLYNQYPQSLKDYINWDAEEFYVWVKFEYLGKVYETDLRYSTKKSSRSLLCLTDQKEITSTSGVTEFLNELFDTKIAIASTIAFEHEVDIINTTPSERREYLKKIFDFDFKEQVEALESMIENSKEKSNDLRIKIESLKNMEFERHTLDRPPMSEEAFETRKETKKRLEAEMHNLQQSISQVKEKKKETQLLKEKIDKLKDEKSDFIYKLDKRKAQLTNIENELNEFPIFSPDLPEIKERYAGKKEELEVKLENLKDSAKQKEDIYQKYLEEKSSLGYTQENFEKQLSQRRKAQTSIESEIKQKKKEQEDLASGVCPLCGHEITAEEKQETQSEIDNLTKGYRALQKETSELEDSYEFFKKREIEIQDLNYSIKSIHTNITNIEDKLSSLEESKQKELDSAGREHQSNFNSKKEYYENIAEWVKDKEAHLNDHILPTLNESKEKLSSLEGESQSTIDLEDQITDLKKELDEVTKAIELYNKTIIENESKERINEKIAKDEEKRDKDLIERQKELEKEESLISQYELERKIVGREFPSFIISRKIGELSKSVNEFLAKVYPKYSVTIKETKNALNIYYGEKKSDVRVASGFEKQIYSFAYKYALGQLQGYGILFLDEVDSSASSGNSMKFYATLGNMKEYFEQIFVISHKEEARELLKNEYDAKVYYVEGGNYQVR